jgi:hypothetical protein
MYVDCEKSWLFAIRTPYRTEKTMNKERSTTSSYKSGFTLLASVLVLVTNACAPPDSDEDVETASSAIYNGSHLPDPHFAIALNGMYACGGIIYKSNYIITAAHCIPNWDTNGSGKITSTELSGHTAQILGGPNSSGTVVVRNVDAIWKHPEATFGQAIGSDTALIHITNGLSVTWIRSHISQANKLYTTGGTLRLWPKVSDSGFFPGLVLDTFGRQTNDLTTGAVSVVNTQGTGGWYEVGPIQNQGTSCPGDSGGPDIRFSLADAWMTGLHSTSDTGACGGPTAPTSSSSIKAAYVKSWIEGIAGT